MRLHGLRRLLRQDGVEVLEKAVAELPWPQVTASEYVGMEERPADRGVLRLGAGSTERFRSRRSRRSEEGERFSVRLGGACRTVRGCIVGDRPSDAARFLMTHLEVDPEDEELSEVEKTLARLRGHLDNEELARLLEKQVAGDEKPDWFVLRDDLQPQRVKIGEEVWYFDSSYGDLSFTAELPLAHGLRGMAAGRVMGERLLCFDGQQLHAVPADSREAQRLYARFDASGHLWESIESDVLPMSHLEPLIWLRIPTSSEASEVIERIGTGSEGLRSLSLPEALPPCGYVNDCFDPIPGLDGVKEVIEEPEGVMAALARIDHGVYMQGTPATPIDPGTFSDEPAFIVLTRVRV